MDGWFLPQDVYTIYAQGKQNDIPLITGGTNDEGAVGGLGTEAASPPNTLAAYTAWVKQIFGPRADAILRAYPAKTDGEAAEAYHDVYRDINFAVHRTWARLQTTTGKSPVYLYRFSHVPPHPVTVAVGRGAIWVVRKGPVVGYEMATRRRNEAGQGWFRSYEEWLSDAFAFSAR